MEFISDSVVLVAFIEVPWYRFLYFYDLDTRSYISEDSIKKHEFISSFNV